MAGCTKKAFSGRLCPMHRMRLRNHGSLDARETACVDCSTSLGAQSGRGKLRCPECQRRRKNERAKEVYKSSPQGREAIKAHSRRYYRANRARLEVAAKAWQKANPEKVARIQRAAKVRRRARIKQTPVVPYLRADIFERDGWMCQLCHEAIDRTAVSPDWLSASIDHIVPIALGGGDTPENVQASHRICNIRKGARLTA